jgi:site-specific recombinase XerD
MKNHDFSFYLTNYLTVFLPGQKGLKTNSILSYRDAFILFLRFCQDCKGIKIEKLSFAHINRKLIEEYLTWLETEKGTTASTRNQRLTAIRCFFKYIQTEAPEHLLLCQSIITIDYKKHVKPSVNYLTQDGITALLAQPSTATMSGRRDLILLETLYDTAARVQELCDIKVEDVRMPAPATIKLTGKGGKTRYVPLSSSVATLLRQYLAENKLDTPVAKTKPLFANRSGQPLTRGGVGYILQKYADMARALSPEDIPQIITPHCLRHSKAMHLLQSGINLIYIRDFLGHMSIETTQIYAKADPELKRKAIVSAYSDDLPRQMPSWSEDPDLMKRLMALGRG